jgi:hypothetical protein
MNHIADKKFPNDLEELLENPEILGNATPEEWYAFLSKTYDVKPLGDGYHKNRSFADGGGFRVFWADRLLLYHPEKMSHHNGAYWKISSGRIRKNRYDLLGNPKLD